MLYSTYSDRIPDCGSQSKNSAERYIIKKCEFGKSLCMPQKLNIIKLLNRYYGFVNIFSTEKSDYIKQSLGEGKKSEPKYILANCNVPDIGTLEHNINVKKFDKDVLEYYSNTPADKKKIDIDSYKKFLDNIKNNDKNINLFSKKDMNILYDVLSEDIVDAYREIIIDFFISLTAFIFMIFDTRTIKSFLEKTEPGDILRYFLCSENYCDCEKSAP